MFADQRVLLIAPIFIGVVVALILVLAPLEACTVSDVRDDVQWSSLVSRGSSDCPGRLSHYRGCGTPLVRHVGPATWLAEFDLRR